MRKRDQNSYRVHEQWGQYMQIEMEIKNSVLKRINEEELLCSFFGNRKGFFLDVGANHPIDGSQTYGLEKLGWSGICVEPQPKYAQLHEQLRKSKIVCCACGSQSQAGRELTLYALEENASLVPSLVLYSALDQIKVSYSVPVETIDKILESNNTEKLDFLSIDVEGFEMDVFAGFSINRWRPSLILVEDHLYDHKVHRLLKESGYKLIRRTELNMWYVPCNFPIKLSKWAKFQLFHKLYLAHVPRLWRRFYHAIIKPRLVGT